MNMIHGPWSPRGQKRPKTTKGKSSIRPIQKKSVWLHWGSVLIKRMVNGAKVALRLNGLAHRGRSCHRIVSVPNGAGWLNYCLESAGCGDFYWSAATWSLLDGEVAAIVGRIPLNMDCDRDGCWWWRKECFGIHFDLFLKIKAKKNDQENHSSNAGRIDSRLIDWSESLFGCWIYLHVQAKL